MKTIATALAAALSLSACAGMSTNMADNTKPYSCADYNTARAKVAAQSGATLNELYKDPAVLRFMKVNLVGFKASMPKHPGNRDAVMKLIDNTTNLQALQCRMAPDATVRYAAEQVTPASVRLGYSVDFKSAAPEAVKDAMADYRMGKNIPNEKGMESVKAFIQNCGSKSAPASVCKLGGL